MICATESVEITALDSLRLYLALCRERFNCVVSGAVPPPIASILRRMQTNDDPIQTTSRDRRLAYSPAEFASLFGRHQTWGYSQLYKGNVRAITKCGRIMIPRSEVDRLLNSATKYDGKGRSTTI